MKIKKVIIWDITNNYNLKHIINTEYGDTIYSCLLIFPENNDKSYIVTSTFSNSGKDEDSAIKIYLLDNYQFLRNIKNTNNIPIFYLLSWYNQRDKNNYIIQLASNKIIINNLLDEEIYSELYIANIQKEFNHVSGFIYKEKNEDYLCSSLTNGYINIWNLYDGTLTKSINTFGCKLGHIIEWNKRYIIATILGSNILKITDKEKGYAIYDINNEHYNSVYCIKKIIHPIYGESLIISGNQNTLELYSI